MNHSLFIAFLKSVVFVMLLLGLGGCVTNYGAAAFDSSPDAVQVFDMEDGSVIGVTPVQFLWRSGKVKRKYMNVRMQKEGYQDAVKSFWLSLDYKSEKDARTNPQLVQFKLIKVTE
ncbi:MAG: hypothetical protein WBM41_20260 [Arenicellales bacterium]